MDPQLQSRIRDDLQSFFKGKLLFDHLSRNLYSTDASIFQIQPAGIAIPEDEADLRALVKYAFENRVPLVPRGAGTGIAGESLGAGLILDVSQSFREILEVTPDTIRVQPGVTQQAVNNRLASIGRRFAPDPASGGVCTIGGMLATNASGSRVLKYGYTHQHVESVRFVLDNSDIVLAKPESWPQPPLAPVGHLHDILEVLGHLLEQNQNLIKTYKIKTPYDRSGYPVHDILKKGKIDLPRLLVGSEGTLGIFLEATLKTIPLPLGRSVVFIGFASVEGALRGTQLVLPTGPSACEMLDRRLLSLTRGSDISDLAHQFSSGIEAALLVEYETDSIESAKSLALDLVKQFEAGECGALQVIPALEPGLQSKIWRLREVALPSLYGLRGGAQPIPFVEDVAVPVQILSEYLRGVQEILKAHETTASFFVHAGAGQVHIRPFLDLNQPRDVSKLMDLAESIYELTLALGGTISSQHGTGLARTPWIAKQFGPLTSVLRQVKAIFDPRGIFNPGKIVDPNPQQGTWPLRQLPQSDSLKLELRWQSDEFRQEASLCNGCGICRTESENSRMCPVFRATKMEQATPRAKANLLRDLLARGANGEALGSKEVREVADLCINCKMCANECPAHVQIPRLMLEAKAANVAQHGLDRTEWFFARLEHFVQWGSVFPLATNWGLANKLVRWIFSKMWGLSTKKRLPKFAYRNFLSLADRKGWTRLPRSKRPRLALFVDLFVNHFDPQVGEAAVLVFQHNGFDVVVPKGQRSSGMEALSHGDVETAREVAAVNLRIFAEFAREGIPIVCLEPSSALMFRQDYLHLIGDSDARMVSEYSMEFSAFMNQLALGGKMRTDFHPLPIMVGHHVPCHIKALGPLIAGNALLKKIPELSLKTVDVGCSGMAGTYGLDQRNYLTSMAAGDAMIQSLLSPEIQWGSSECSSCRMQMEEGSRKRSLHPAQYLAWAYGLMPEVANRLKEPVG